MPDKHALLSLSGSKAWLNCTMMPRFTENLPDTETEAAYEGTVAHDIAEWTMRLILGHNSPKYCKARIKERKEEKWGDKKFPESENVGKPIYDTAMCRYVREYVAFVMEQYGEALRIDPNAKIFLETEVRVDKYVPEGFGTADVMIAMKNKFVGIDLKYGKGVLVEAENNSQLKLYALGAALLLDHEFDFDFFEMHIYQPRLDNFGMMEISRSALIDWARYVVKPKARLAWEGKGEFVTGEYCRFCKGFTKCPAIYDKAKALANYKFARIPYLPDEAVVEIYRLATVLSAYITDTKKDALEATLKEGKEWPGLMLTNGRAQRQYKDAEAVAERLRTMGFKDTQIFKTAILGITAMEELLGGEFDQVLGDLIHKPAGSPTLVVDDGKRKPYSKIDGKFKDLTTNNTD